MGRRLIFDTSTMIAYERRDIERSQFDDDQVAIAAISVAAFREGAARADTPERRAVRLAVLEEIQRVVDVLPYTEDTAIHHAVLLAFTRTAGKPRGAHDVIIAAHAAETDRIIVTRDAGARFGELPGVVAVEPG